MKALRIAAIALAALALVGCTAGAQASSTPPAVVESTAASPTQEPDPAPADIIVSGAGFTLVDTTGQTVFTHIWANEVAPAVTALSDAFQSEPSLSKRDGSGGHFADFDLYTWGAFTLGDAVGLEKMREDYFLPSLVEVTEPVVAGIGIRTASGLAVGSSVAAVNEVEPLVREERADVAFYLYKVDPENPSALPYVDGGEITNMVSLQADATDTSISLLKAPILSYYPF